MGTYVFAQDFAWGDAQANASRIIGYAREKRFGPQDTLVFSASALAGFVNGRGLLAGNLAGLARALRKIARDTKKAPPRLLLPALGKAGTDLYEIKAGQILRLACKAVDGGLLLPPETSGLPFALVFRTEPFTGEDVRYRLSDAVIVDPTCYDAGEVFAGFCSVVRKGKRVANYAAPETFFDVNATKVGTLEARARTLLAMQTGLKLFMRRFGFTDVTLGLSGGMDSAFVAALAVKTLGPDRVHPVFMPGPYTTEASVADARLLAENLGTELAVAPIAPYFESFLAGLGEGILGAGLARQNIQARLRANILMARSNADGSLVLATSNKSEAAVGYGTLYGDMAGGFNFIGDVFKTELYELAASDAFLREAIPAGIFAKAPSAELAPNQKDSDDLPEYGLLDRILAQLVAGKELEAVKKHFEARTVDFIARRVARAHFKREQSCPVLRLSPHPLSALSEKTFV